MESRESWPHHENLLELAADPTPVHPVAPRLDKPISEGRASPGGVEHVRGSRANLHTARVKTTALLRWPAAALWAAASVPGADVVFVRLAGARRDGPHQSVQVQGLR